MHSQSPGWYGVYGLRVNVLQSWKPALARAQGISFNCLAFLFHLGNLSKLRRTSCAMSFSHKYVLLLLSPQETSLALGGKPDGLILTDLTIVCFTFHVGKAATKKQKYEKISEKKMSTPVEVLCKVIFQLFACFLTTIA